MNLKLITPERVLFDGPISELIVPTTTGEIAILPGHVNLLTQLTSGELTIKSDKKDHHIALTGGFLQIVDNSISLISDFAIRSDDIDTKKALEAQKSAEELIKKGKSDQTEQDFAIAQSEMRKAILQLKVANKRRRSPIV